MGVLTAFLLTCTALKCTVVTGNLCEYCLNSGRNYKWSNWKPSHGYCHIEYSTEASLLRRKPRRTLFSSLVDRRRHFSTTTGQLRPSWNQYVCISVIHKTAYKIEVNCIVQSC